MGSPPFYFWGTTHKIFADHWYPNSQNEIDLATFYCNITLSMGKADDHISTWDRPPRQVDWPSPIHIKHVTIIHKGMIGHTEPLFYCCDLQVPVTCDKCGYNSYVITRSTDGSWRWSKCSMYFFNIYISWSPSSLSPPYHVSVILFFQLCSTWKVIQPPNSFSPEVHKVLSWPQSQITWSAIILMPTGQTQ